MRKGLGILMGLLTIVIAGALAFNYYGFDTSADTTIVTSVASVTSQNGKITGKITRETDGKPVKKATVIIKSGKTGKTVKKIKTDKNGIHSIKLKSKTYVVDAKSGNPYLTRESKSYVIVKSAKTTTVNLILKKIAVGSIVGKVSKQDGTVAKNVLIMIMPDFTATQKFGSEYVKLFPEYATLDDQGNYKAAELIPGDYTVGLIKTVKQVVDPKKLDMDMDMSEVQIRSKINVVANQETLANFLIQ